MARAKQTGARKATNYRAKAIQPEQAFDPRSSRATKAYSTYDSVMDGDEDQFHLNRDRMLLDDGTSARGRRGGAADDDDDALDVPDTVYDLDLPSDSDVDEDEEQEADLDEEDDEPPNQSRQRKEYKRAQKDDTTKGRYGHQVDPKQDIVFPDSDDSDDDDDDDDDTDGSGVDVAQLESTLDDSDDDSSSRRRKKKGGADEDDDEEDEEDERWAAGHYHVSRRAPGEADSSDDEALELEEAEARRLQKRARERMHGADFGLDEDSADELGAARPGAEERLRFDDEEVTEKAGHADARDPGAPREQDPAAAHLGEADAIAHLLKTQPETLALVDDFVLTASKIQQVAQDLEVVRQGDDKGGEHPALAIMELEHQALTTYLPTLAFYFSLLLAPTPAPSALIEKVLARLSSLRERLATMEELDLTSTTYGAEDDEEDEDEEDEEEAGAGGARGGRSRRQMLASEAMDFHAGLANGEDSDEEEEDDEEDEENEEEEVTDSMLAGLDDDELEALMGELGPGDGAEELMKRVRAKQAEKHRGGEEAGFAGYSDDEPMLDEEEEEEERRIAAARAAKSKKSKKQQAIVVPELAPLSRGASTTTSAADGAPRASVAASAASDYLDPLALSASDRADKTSQRHTLRFHVAQVAQKAARREARRTGLEADDDVPRRSKEQARREVLKRQEHGAAKDAKARAALDEGDFDEEDRKAARAVRGDRDEAEAGGGDDDDDYYDLVAAEKDEGRRAKKVKYEDQRAAEKAEIEALAASSVDGPRGASRQILANKGLTPKRKKENRNARVKKRRQYDDKKKKLRSMQATYSGGEARTGYEGERSGISRATVKSVKLG